MIKANMSASAEGRRLSITLYDDIESDGWWSISDTSSKTIKAILDENPGADQIDVYINSYGGEVKEGIAIYNLFKRSDAYVTAYIDGFACSIASVIAMAADKVVMGPTSLMMIHHAWIWAAGNAKELRKAADDVEIIDSASKQAYVLRTGDKLTEEKLDELLDNESWLTAQMCIDYGFADEISDFTAPDIQKSEEDPEPDPVETAKSNYERFRAQVRESQKKSVFQQMKAGFEKSNKGEIKNVH